MRFTTGSGAIAGSSRSRWRAALLAVAVVAGGCGGSRDSGDSGATGTAMQAAPGVTDTSIKLGGSYPLSGPASAYGAIARSVQGYFRYVNEEQGGVRMGDGKTRKIDFVAYDDGYTAPRIVENSRRLIEQDQVFALFNTLGTPTNAAIWDYVNQREVPHLFLATGASVWGFGQESHPWSIGWQPAYPTESAVYAEHLKRQFPQGASVAVLYQNDDSGKDYISGFKAAIKGSNITIVQEQSYQVSDPTVDSQVTSLARTNAQVFFNMTTPKFGAQAIKKVAELGWRPTHVLVSVAASIESVLKPAGLQNAKGVISAQYVKEPSDPLWANDEAMQTYRRLAARYAPDLNVNDPFGVYGFAVAETMVRALERTKAPTREALMESVRNLDTEVGLFLPGVRVRTTPDDPFPIETMRLAQFNGERWEPIGEPVDYEGRTPEPAA